MDILLGTNVLMPLEWLRIAVAVIGVGLAAYYDIFNNKNVPERLLQGFLVAAVAVSIIAYDPVATPYGLAAGALLYIANWIVYKAGYLGGADGPILAAIAVLLPAQPLMFLLDQSSYILTFPFVIHVLTVAFFTFMVHMLLRTIPSALKAVRTPGSIAAQQWIGAFLILIAYGFLSFTIASSPLLSTSYIIFLAFLSAVSVYFVLFRQAINDSMLEWVVPKKVEVEDIIAPEKMDAAEVKKYSIGRLVDAEEWKRLQRIKGKVPVYKHLLPFVPHILIGLVVSLLLGNILLAVSGFSSPLGY